jgi:hypothetical protein
MHELLHFSHSFSILNVGAPPSRSPIPKSGLAGFAYRRGALAQQLNSQHVWLQFDVSVLLGPEV